MREFISVFLACLFVCAISMFFLFNIWGLLIFISLFLAIIITGFYKLSIKIEHLEKKVEELLNHRQQTGEDGKEGDQ